MNRTSITALLLGLALVSAAQAQDELSQVIEQDRIEMVRQRVGPSGSQFPVNGRDGVVPLLVAVRSNALQSAQWLLSQGASVDVRSPSGSTALSLAAYYGNAPMVRVLIDAGAKLGTKSPNGYQPLDWAMEANREQAFEVLLLAWGLQDARNEHERTVLRDIQHGTPIRLGQPGDYSSYPLVLAIARNQPIVLEQLLKAGHDPNLQNSAGYAPLPTAARLGRTDLVALLLRYRADPNIGGTPGHDVAGALNQAARGLQVDAARTLIDHGANVNRGNAIGITPLYVCAVSDQEHGTFTRLLLDRGAELRQRAQDGYDPLDAAMEHRNRLFMQLAMASLLWQSVADPAQRAALQTALASDTGSPRVTTPESAVLLLNYAIVKGDAALFEATLKTGVPPDTRNRSGHYPLSLAASWGETAMLQQLLTRHAQVDQQNENRYRTSALMESTRDGKLDIARALLAAGANVNLPDAHQDHALNWVVFFGHEPMVDLLLAHRADVTRVGSQSADNAMDIAIRRKFPKIVARLAQAGAKASK